MAKTRTYRVINNRLQFKCPECGARRYYSVPTGMRRRSVRCHNCDTLVRCELNRREKPRHSQLGKVDLLLPSGKELVVDLHDISRGGIGFDLPLRAGKMVSAGQRITLRCKWNPGLLNHKSYVVRTIKGQRVGAQASI